MSIFKKNYFDIGKNGTADQFFRELQKAAKSNCYPPDSKFNTLIKGAREAFADGRPENIQMAFHSSGTIAFGEGFVVNHYSYFTSHTLYELSEKSNDPPAVIELALAKASAEDKQEILNIALGQSVLYDGARFVTALLEAGADATVECTDTFYSYRRTDMLGKAVLRGSWRAVKALYEHGASFDAARQRMLSAGWDAHSIDKLEFYRDAITDKPAAADAGQPSTEEVDIPERLREIQEQMRELTEEALELKSKISVPAAVPPARRIRLKISPRPLNH